MGRIRDRWVLTSGTQPGTSSFPTSLARYLEPTTSGIGSEVGGSGGDADYLAIAPELQPDMTNVELKRVGKQETG